MINYIKDNLFKSMQKLINIIIQDYFKMLGFIIGIGNEYFNYIIKASNIENIYSYYCNMFKPDNNNENNLLKIIF